MKLEISEVCVDMLYLSFNSEVSEQNYHDIVECLRNLKDILTIDKLKLYYSKYKFPDTYNPFDVMEQLRFAYVFGKHNVEVENKCVYLKEALLNS